MKRGSSCQMNNSYYSCVCWQHKRLKISKKTDFCNAVMTLDALNILKGHRRGWYFQNRWNQDKCVSLWWRTKLRQTWDHWWRGWSKKSFCKPRYILCWHSMNTTKLTLQMDKALNCCKMEFRNKIFSTSIFQNWTLREQCRSRAADHEGDWKYGWIFHIHLL